MALQFFGAYHLPVKKVFRSLGLPPSTTPVGTFLLWISFGAIILVLAKWHNLNSGASVGCIGALKRMEG
jgi:hypothetical protein